MPDKFKQTPPRPLPPQYCITNRCKFYFLLCFVWHIDTWLQVSWVKTTAPMRTPLGTCRKTPKCKRNEQEVVNYGQSEVKDADLWGAADEDVLTGEQHQTVRLSSLYHWSMVGHLSHLLRCPSKSWPSASLSLSAWITLCTCSVHIY